MTRKARGNGGVINKTKEPTEKEKVKRWPELPTHSFFTQHTPDGTINMPIPPYIFRATKNGAVDISEYETHLYRHGPNLKDARDLSLLHIAAWNANVDEVLVIINHPHFRWPRKDPHGRSILHAAVMCHGIVAYDDARINTKTFNNPGARFYYFKRSPIDEERAAQVYKILRPLMNTTAMNEKLDGLHPLLLAMASGRSGRIIHMIIRDQHLVLTDKDHEEIWDFVLRSDNIEYMKLLLKFPPKFSIYIRFYNGLSLLGWSIQCLAFKCAAYIIDKELLCTSCCGIDEMQTTKTTPLLVALRQPTLTPKAQENKLKIIEFLSNHKTSVQLPFDEPIIHAALEDSDPRILEVLLGSIHATPNGTDHEHCPPIVRAVWSAGNTSLDTLLRSPAIRISHNYTLAEFRDKEMRPMQSPLLWDPLLQAIQERRPDKVHRLLAAGADPNMVAGWDRLAQRKLSTYQLCMMTVGPVSYTHLRAHETPEHLV